MKIFRLEDMTGGWFVGNFEPSCLKTNSHEVACKKYAAGDSEPSHVHRVATEITLIVSGQVLMNGRRYSSGDIIMLDPGEATDFCALEDTVTMVVKTPSVIGDKFLVDYAKN